LGLTRERRDVPVQHGSTIFVPGGEMHQLRNTGQEVLRFICLIPQEWLGEVTRPTT